MTTLKDNAGRRQVYLDACRGFTMLLVIYSHIAYFIGGGTTEINRFFVLFRMPLFFFVSGFLAYSADYDLNKLKQRSLNRIVRQLYPTVLIWALFCVLTAPHTDSGDFAWNTALYDQNKQGYWFTLVAVELFFFIAPGLHFMSRYRFSRAGVAVVLLLLAAGVLWFTHNTIKPGKGSQAWVMRSLFSIDRVLDYAVFFLFGMMVKVFCNEFHRLVRHWWCFAAALAAFLSAAVWGESEMYRRNGMIDYDAAMYIICALAGIVMLYSLFYRLGQYSNPHILTGLSRLAVVGRHTLEIYLLHYLLLFLLRPYLGVDWLVGSIDSWYELPLLLSLSGAIICLILGLVGLLRRLHLYALLFPTAKPRRTPSVSV